MNKNIYLYLLICLVLFIPGKTEAQFFARQKVLVWDLFDRNNDVKVAVGTKELIRSNIEQALVGSRNYEAYTDISSIRNSLNAQTQKLSPTEILLVAKNSGVDYVVFTTLKILDRSSSYQDYNVHLSSELISTETQKSERIAYVDFKSQLDQVPAACAKLLSDLLREQLAPQSSQSHSNQNSQLSSSQQQSSQQRTQNYTETVEGINMQMVYVEGGTFTMGATEEQSGDARSDESPTHRVTLDSYYIGAYEVTQAQWRAVMGSNPSYFTGDSNPVEKVSWHDAQAFCQELSNLTDKTYILPTEAQWEYAARGGNKSRKNKYSGSFAIDAVAWYTSNSGSKTHLVGQKRANELGIYDMSGNVWEWCSDWYGRYSSSPQTSPTGPSSGQYRVLRGGSWFNDASYCRVSYRRNGTPSIDSFNIGFRVVCIP